MTKERYLTKSRFRMALECPSKVYYEAYPDQYANQSSDNAFLKALAEGGFQVGELAKIQFGPGIEISSMEHSVSLKSTSTALEERETVTLFEPAFLDGKCFVRVDVLKKNKNQIEIFEVKAKSADSKSPPRFLQAKKKALLQEQRLYICDIAFQTYVIRKCLPQSSVLPRLVYADKAAIASTNGIHQKFKLEKDENGRSRVSRDPNLTQDDIGSPLLTVIDVENEVNAILNNEIVIYEDSLVGPLFFQDFVNLLESSLATKQKIKAALQTECRDCQFRNEAHGNSGSLKSGFHECWKNILSNESNESKTVLSLWNSRNKQKWMNSGIFLLEQLKEEDFEAPNELGDTGLTDSQRQWIQIQSTVTNASEPYVARKELRKRIDKLKFPLHFIDFETTRVAIPFFKNWRPYEQLAFQFSHHIMYESGRVEHYGQHFCDEPGAIPNFEFVRKLKKQLEKDDGTILRFALHENSVLRDIHKQLERSNENDRTELQQWIDSITTWQDEEKNRHAGPRNMVDMLEIVKKTFYSPKMGGSNSIKVVLPASLSHSKYLLEKYSKPIYGMKNEIKSLNFTDWTWLQHDIDGTLKNPYKILPKIFSNNELAFIEKNFDENEVCEGGAAMMAYAKMQFSEMSQFERKKIQDALLRYCELDTLAMVMIMEYWLYDLLHVQSLKDIAV